MAVFSRSAQIATKGWDAQTGWGQVKFPGLFALLNGTMPGPGPSNPKPRLGLYGARS